MTTRRMVKLGAAALLIGGTVVSGIAVAGSNAAAVAKAARKDAGAAAKALGRHQSADAIVHAESAVALAPRDAGYRMILGQSYMAAGRFAAARQTFADVLQLTPGDAKAALNLALTQIATGDWSGARRTLDANAQAIPASDLGLAIALAGDPAGAVSLLTDAARRPGADAKIRQNLALALALSGNWSAARVVAAADMSPADVDQRMTDWAAFAQPHAASDQVASLIGVASVSDAGQPIALALNAAVPVAPAPVATPPIATAAAALPVAPTPVLATVAATDPAPAPAPAATIIPAATKILFAAPRELVQPLPVPLIKPDRPISKVAFAKAQAIRAVVAATPRPQAKGDFYVQFGAFENAAVAKDGWARVARRAPALAGRTPSGGSIKTKAGTFYRLSIGGFARGDADSLCHRYRRAGGACFVRAGAGDQIAQWSKRTGVQLAAR